MTPASVVVVMYNSAATIESCLRSIPGDCEVVLVDQQSCDESTTVALSARPDARLILAGANRGFGAGCNLGAANATSDVLIFLNPDALFTGEAARMLADRVRLDNALVGPRILGEDGCDQTRARTWSRPLADLGEIFLPTALTRGILARDIPPDDAVYRLGGRVPYVQGSCMALSAKAFWLAGGFDERHFLYGEEEVLARRLDSLAIPTVLEPLAVITHLGARSTSGVRDFAAHQYYRSAAMSALAVNPRYVAIPTVATMWLLLTVMAILTPVRRLVGWRAEKGRSWYRSGASGVLAGLVGRAVTAPAADPRGRGANADRPPRLGS